MKLNNKKGNIPIIILVLGVLIVCGLALLSFYNSNLKVSNNFVGVKLIEKLSSQIEVNQYQGKSVDGLNETKEVRNYRFKGGFLKEKKIFFVTYNPPT